ncbi:MAG: HPP family protein [Pseudomonadota bacterium]|nr:HPP family protein [Pseudomonadota bacterium]
MRNAVEARWGALREMLGIEGSPVSHIERLVSTAGGFVGILLVLLVSRRFVGEQDAALIVASMGASAVLLFAVPHGPLSQPWPVAGGHLVSALIGVSCARFVPDPFVAAAMAVGLAIGAMHYLRCIHPPGGATALVAVVGGPGIHGLGYGFVLAPVALNVAVILATAVVFNYPWRWRRYPAALKPPREQAEAVVVSGETAESISHGDLVYALSQIDSFIDVNEHDLLRIYDMATRRMQTRHLNPAEIGLGRYYSNGEYGDDWQIRCVVDESPHVDPDKDSVIFKIVAGQGRRTSGVSTRADFARWARHEVVRNESSWQRIESADE